ncbi:MULTISPECIES: hypothetical protein [Methanosarcina]|uniref:Uncharacterized protein n=7 Tax=Methanosarcina mazei TaxID=2209 RepID=A0A0F8SR34_METMZ|nr:MULTISPECIES: hypothetical protein [Methanosarcina]AAM31142.1 hypothetical protein MM_1446 [Methanosarcina mazei Go1]AKB42190.1 hypothetical protein MSMAW_3199 [Methanosarcina mazei WWM610]AKB63070.1 hypothetical protein MSMAP_3085 [Methanosarcina mazei SarPi]AKB66414.1 hypothetical protein MSMAS_3218 [Methanosarcina mazei S-6]AKB69761.1 hypothetical protein MSMAL_3218 [Methanosarcina mazei LYC]
MEPAIADSYPEKRWIPQEIKTVYRLWKTLPDSIKNLSGMLCKCHSGIQKRGGNPGNLTRLNGFRVHSIYMIRFPP